MLRDILRNLLMPAPTQFQERGGAILFPEVLVKLALRQSLFFVRWQKTSPNGNRDQSLIPL